MVHLHFMKEAQRRTATSGLLTKCAASDTLSMDRHLSGYTVQLCECIPGASVSILISNETGLAILSSERETNQVEFLSVSELGKKSQ